jgi:hypothetical protein
MTKPSGKSIAISPFRSMVVDLMYFSQQVPAATVERRMNLAPLVAARQRCLPRPMWTSILIKAYSLVSLRMPILRRSYMTIPWTRYYEHPKNIATINLSRRVGEEDVVLQAQIRSPENRTLEELDAIVRHYSDTPMAEIKSCRRVQRVSYLPWPIRRLLMWTTLNLFGRRRCHNFGTFCLTSVAGQGSGVLNMTPLLTSSLHHGMLDANGCMDVRLNFDHRVMDGAPAAEALALLEMTLLREILDEVKARGATLPVAGRLAA